MQILLAHNIIVLGPFAYPVPSTSWAQAGPVLLYLHWQSGSNPNRKLDIVIAPNGSSVMILTHLMFLNFKNDVGWPTVEGNLQTKRTLDPLHFTNVNDYTNTPYLFMSSLIKKTEKSPQSGMHFFISDQHTQKEIHNAFYGMVSDRSLGDRLL